MLDTKPYRTATISIDYYREGNGHFEVKCLQGEWGLPGLETPERSDVVEMMLRYDVLLGRKCLIPELIVTDEARKQFRDSTRN